MSVKDFWEGEPYLFWAYADAYELKSKERDQEEWKLGLYIHNAVETIIYNAFGRKKGQPPSHYMDAPLLKNMGKSAEQIEKEETIEREDKIRQKLSRSKEILDTVKKEKNKGK